MFSLKVAATLILASGHVTQFTPPKPPRAPVVMVKPPAPAPLINLFSTPTPAAAVEDAPEGYEDSFVRVEGVEGRLVVLPSIMQEFNLTLGQEIPVHLMYQLLERNRKLY
jgi:hypothetical protein